MYRNCFWPGWRLATLALLYLPRVELGVLGVACVYGFDFSFDLICHGQAQAQAKANEGRNCGPRLTVWLLARSSETIKSNKNLQRPLSYGCCHFIKNEL